jgi:hypothetical protein
VDTISTKHKVDLVILKQVYVHSSGRVTPKYVGVQGEKLVTVYMLRSAVKELVGVPKHTVVKLNLGAGILLI